MIVYEMHARYTRYTFYLITDIKLNQNIPFRSFVIIFVELS